MTAPRPPYVMLESQHGGTSVQPPPYRKNVPKYHSKKRSSGGKCCMRCICCCYCCLFLLILIPSILSFYIYVVYDPKSPSYKVQNLEVKSFDVQPDFSLNTEFVVTVRADNPNTNIGFDYGKESSVVVTYSDLDLCTGKLPSFYHGYLNTTMVNVDLKGKSEFGSGLQEAFAESRKNNKVPLLVKVKIPVTVVIGHYPLRQFNAFVNCSLLLDNLAPNKKINILSSNTTYYFGF